MACSDPKERNFLKQFEARLCDVCNGPVIGGTSFLFSGATRVLLIFFYFFIEIFIVKGNFS